MSYDGETADRVRRILSRRLDVVERKMFGELCFMVNENMCGGPADTAFTRSAARATHGCHRPTLDRHRASRSSGNEADVALANWVQRGVDFVSTKAPGKRPKDLAERRDQAVSAGTAGAVALSGSAFITWRERKGAPLRDQTATVVVDSIPDRTNRAARRAAGFPGHRSELATAFSEALSRFVRSALSSCGAES